LSDVEVYDIEGQVVETISLPKVFQTAIRPDIIKKAVLMMQSHSFQPQGRNPMAGKRTTAESMGTGLGIARLPRVKGSRYPKARQAAFAPNTVGGRQTHPPRSEKIIYKKINRKERHLAIKSAIAATANKEQVSNRGHIIGDIPSLPLVVSDELQSLSKSSDVRDFFKNLGLWSDVNKVKSNRKIRAGRGKMRGRKYKRPIGPLIIVSEDKGVIKAARNHPGVEISHVNKLNVELLAPGTHPGRLTVWTKSAMLQIDNLFR
jgi:large subunit ribosomal protein L4e